MKYLESQGYKRIDHPFVGAYGRYFHWGCIVLAAYSIRKPSTPWYRYQFVVKVIATKDGRPYRKPFIRVGGWGSVCTLPYSPIRVGAEYA